MLFDRQYAVPHLLSMLIALSFVFAVVRRPPLARKLYLGLFAYAALVNGVISWLAPQSYVENAQYALLEIYRAFIIGWFAHHVRPMVGAIALGQALVAMGLFVGGRAAQAALLGAITFFVAITPLGAGAAFPSSLVWAAGAAWMLIHAPSRAALNERLRRRATPSRPAHT